MPFFIATMSHPDEDGWNRRLAAHVAYLNDLVAVGNLRASGPLIGAPRRSGFLIFTVADRVAGERLIENLTITERDPLFGAFAVESSGHLPGLPAPLPTEA